LKAFLLLVVLSAAGLAGVLYWRQSLHRPSSPVVGAGGPGKDRHRRRRRGARRLARNEAFVAAAPPGETPAGDVPGGEASGREVPSPAFAPSPPPEERAPLAPGGSATTEAAPSEVFGALTAPSGQAPGGGRRQAVAEPEPIKLRPADLKMIWQGEDLSRTETMRLDFSKEGGRELSQDEIDARFRTKEDAVLACIQRARPDEYTDIPGRVNVRFRIQRTGPVKGVQVEAPVILQKGGLTGCIKGVLGGLKFPASNASQVITYPFSLL
jgi:hypothetical protein